MMSRRSFLLAIAIFACLTGGAGSGLWMLVRYEPPVYLRAAVPPGEDRHKLSEVCQYELIQLFSSLKDHEDHEERSWTHHFTDKQINSYLAEHFVQSRLEEHLLPEGIREPRIVIESDKVRLAFRYGSGLWSTVILIDLQIWLPEGEANVVALKLVGFHAGAMPISAQSLLERISEVGRNNGIAVDWYRDDGYPVALVRLQADQSHPTLELEAVQLEQGKITIQGRSRDPASLRAFLQNPFTAFKLAAD
jgi:hypothetical protein